MHGALVCARRTTDPEINPFRKQRLQSAKLFRNDQRGVIGQHNAARPEADCFRTRTQMRDDNRRGRTRDADHIMMFGDPIAVVATGFCRAGEIQRIGQGVAGVLSF